MLLRDEIYLTSILIKDKSNKYISDQTHECEKGPSLVQELRSKRVPSSIAVD